MSTILITGANGFIGQYLVKQLLDRGSHRVIGTGTGASHLPFAVSEQYQYHRMDITDRQQVEKILVSWQPGVIIHAAALGQPDYCELHEQACFSVNVQGTQNVVETGKKINSFLVYLSTDFVFDGSNGPYREEDPTNPVNRYGESKVAGERMINESGIDHAIVRLCAVYGIPFSGNARNIITWVKENLESGRSIQAVSDQVRTPTYIDDAVAAIIRIVEKRIRGTFHISGNETFTPYEMALTAANHLGLGKKLIQKVQSSILQQPAKRPLITGFITDKAKNTFGFFPKNFSDALGEIFPRNSL